MKEDEICYADLGNPVGHEQGGERPIIIIKVLTGLGLCVVVPLTTSPERLTLPYTFMVNSTKSTNLEKASVALVFHIRTISSERMVNVIGVLEESHSKKLKSFIKDMLSIQ